MPVVFSELAAQYPPHKVRDDNSGVIAANGQYLLVRRAAYDAVGGHAAVATEILEDVALARVFRNAGFRVSFRYGGDAVRTPDVPQLVAASRRVDEDLQRSCFHDQSFWLFRVCFFGSSRGKCWRRCDSLGRAHVLPFCLDRFRGHVALGVH